MQKALGDRDMTRYGMLLALASVASAAEPPRARPPEFTAEDRAAFFDDAFTTLQGDRPVPGAAVADAPPRPTAQASTAAEVAWAELISADVLENEIKRQARDLQQATRSGSSFKAGGYRQAVDALGLAATWFAITAQHRGEPRWRDTAAGLRDLMAESMVEADEATDAAYAAAAARAEDLAGLIRGGRPPTPEPAAQVDWAEIGDRTTLMRRMELAERDRLMGWTADERSLRRNAEDAQHEAQVLAALAEAILQPEAYDYDDPDYQVYAQGLRDAATQLADAAEAEDHPAAAAAMTEISRSCVLCHAGYRG